MSLYLDPLSLIFSSFIQVSLDKLRGAEGQVTVMQREMEAVQPKLVEASKEVDASMSNMEKEQVTKIIILVLPCVLILY